MGQNTKMSQHGKKYGGKQERRKEIAQIAMMHPRTFVAQTTCAHVNHFYRSVIEAMEFDGPALICCFTTCQPEHGVADNMATDQARLSVDTRAFPLILYNPLKGDTIRSRLSLQGNPAVNDDWWTDPKTGKQVDFIDFCRSEGRFAKHFDKNGNPSELLLKAKGERLENWKVLQELAGVFDNKKAPAKAADKAPAAKAPEKAESKPAPSKPAATNGNGGLPSQFQAGCRIRYRDKDQRWINGTLRSIKPAILDLEDGTEIEVPYEVLLEAVALGVITA